ncbi:HPr family phosphocarrier protein [Budvicia diplopodorum]|uniref:HPr family phosphocarrier protein n=1 Tax=Budvicia diplopodorum TaxID=1119056 RepID=UPI00248381C1|nr:HPr family phosphocarrier protein [Budvicia diplopodorum]
MIREILCVNNTTGLHARPASAIVKTVSKHRSKVEFLFKEKVIKGKSVIGLMTAGITGGAKIEVICDGQDETDVFLAIKALFDAGFGEK